MKAGNCQPWHFSLPTCPRLVQILMTVTSSCDTCRSISPSQAAGDLFLEEKSRQNKTVFCWVIFGDVKNHPKINAKPFLFLAARSFWILAKRFPWHNHRSHSPTRTGQARTIHAICLSPSQPVAVQQFWHQAPGGNWQWISL